MMTILMRGAGLGALCAMLTACGAASPQSDFAALPKGAPNAAAHAGKHLIYISLQNAYTGYSQVNAYAAAGTKLKRVSTITSGLALPEGIATDGAGNLYVANFGSNSVTVYPPGQTTPSVTYTQGVNLPKSVAVGSDGTLYVANQGGGSNSFGSVTEYSAGSVTPNVTITLPSQYAFALALDSSNKVYVSWITGSRYLDSIYEYPTEGSGKGSDLNLDLGTNSFPAEALTFDSHGNLIVPVNSFYGIDPKYLAVFPPGATKPKRKISYGQMANVISGLAFAPGSPRELYLVSESYQNLLQLSYPKGLPRNNYPLNEPWGIAFSP
jgi:hypothetical protein